MRNANGHVLNVRKRGTETFMLPGGKPEPSETPADTAAREFEEELGVPLDRQQLRYLGEFRAAAANEAGFEVVAEVYEHPFVEGVTASAEIDELDWFDPALPHAAMAPLNTEVIFPALAIASPDIEPARIRPPR